VRLLLLLALAADVGQRASESAREESFLELLRTYPERPPAETFRQVTALLDQGPFPEHDRAEYWIGSARLAAGDREGARVWFKRLGRDHPGSVWVERSWLGLGDADAVEHNYTESLGWYGRAANARDAAVRELSRIDTSQVLTLRRRQRIAWAFGTLSLAIAIFFLWQGRRALLPLPAETRIALPVLTILSLLSVKIDAAPRAAVLMMTAGGAALSFASGARLRAVKPNKWLHALLALLALAGLAFVAVYREDMIGMVMETFRVGPE
jgi:hypothetical protein